MNAPIFIAGLERSGKTYMRMLLGGHPRLFFSRRTNLWTSYYGRYGDLNRPANLQRCLAALQESTHIRSLAPDFVRIRQELQATSVTYGRLFALIHAHQAERQNRPRWGDQTEFIERQADNVFSAYPEARFIHMLRDPRDRYEAMLHKYQRRGPGVATARWKASALLAARNTEKYPGQYKIVRYESMATEPEATLRAICEFLHEDFVPEMLEMKSEARFAGPARNDADAPVGSLTSQYIGRYQNGLSRCTIAYVQDQLGTLMLGHGYFLEPIELSWMESLRFHLFDTTLNSFSQVGWHIKAHADNLRLWNTSRSSLVG